MKFRKKILVVFLILAQIVSIFSFGIVDAELTAGVKDFIATTNKPITYIDYIAKYANEPKPLVEVLIPSANISSNSMDIVKINDFEGAHEVIKWIGNNNSISFTATIPKNGLYNLAMNFFSIQGKYQENEFAVRIDGELPFESSERFSFKKSSQLEPELRYDSRGNQYTPLQTMSKRWQYEAFYDNEGRYNDPCYFYLTAGTHTFNIYAEKADLAIEYFKLYNKPKIQDYVTVKGNYKSKSSPEKFSQKIQAEQPKYKSDFMILPIYDKSSAATEPQSDTNMLLNTIGGTKWQQPRQWLEWEFEVPKDGLYQFRLRARQNLKNGVSVARRITIDGAVPFAEMGAVIFPFENSWYIKTLGTGALGKEMPYEFELTKGKHTLRMEVVPGEMEQTIQNLQDTVLQLNNTYRKIMMILGPAPDKYRDYNLQAEIPGLMDTFRTQYEILNNERQRLLKITGQGGSETAILQTLIIQLDRFLQKPNTIAQRLDTFKNNASALASWLLTIREQPLELDYIEVQSLDGKVPNANANIFRSIAFNISKIINSFSNNYGIIGEINESKSALTVWVGMGRDQVQILKNLVDTYFVPQHAGIKVNVNLVQVGLVEATLAGKGPDISLFGAPTEPVDLASRGALTDLSKFSDFGEVKSRFSKPALVPFTYLGGIYALPVTETFSMLFVRTDIFKELGISIPKTWDDLYKIAPIIQRNNLSIGIPSGIQPAGVPSDFGVFPTLLYQKGGAFYSNDRSKTRFNEDVAQEAFAQWTDFYVKYSLPTQYDFYSRFRTGEMPIAIAPYTEYNRLSVAAPEIKGMWTMVTLPGTILPNGKLNNSSMANGQGGVILRDAKNKEDAWEFLKWFTSADIQQKFGNALENTMGASARYATSNMEALSYLPWTQNELKVLFEQWNNIEELPEIPGGYYIQRNLSNAFKRVVYNYDNPRHTLNTYNIEINKEIKRKRIEFGLEKE